MRKLPKRKRPAVAPARLDSTRALRAFQRLMKDAVTRPLAPGHLMQKVWSDGRPTAEVVEGFVKPNDRLTAFERLQIYNRMYWFRIIDSFYEDAPGLRAALGEKKFSRLATAYLAKNPSRSFTLRNLCSRLEEFIRIQPRWTAPRTALAREIAGFEWAQTMAFDEVSNPVITPADFARTSPARLKLGLQPYVRLLALQHPVDNYVLAVKRRDTLRAEASNATAAEHSEARLRRVPLPRRERVWMAVHRVDNRLYYKRLELPAFKILTALRDGQTLNRAVAAGGRGVTAEQVQDWFALWTTLGWLCRRK
ncbi:MAG: putative DNA-binding domain-containing protein [Opitutaceae bacterium]